MELLTPSSYARNKIKVRYTPMNGDWFIENKSSDYGNVKADSTFGTKRASAYRIIEDSLNLRDVRIFDYVTTNTATEKRYSTIRKPQRHKQSRSYQTGVCRLDMERPRTQKPPYPFL
jgi:N12 class adenine-specific DNA methylase